MARLICLRLLDRAPRTRAQLAAALHRKGVPDEAAEVVLERFTDVGLIDDEAFAEAWVSSRHRGRGLAGRALRQELTQRGVAQETVSAVVAGLDPDTERQTARELVRRRAGRLAGLAPDVAARRLVGMLARKGYPPGLAYAVVQEALSESVSESVSVEARGSVFGQEPGVGQHQMPLPSVASPGSDLSPAGAIGHR